MALFYLFLVIFLGGFNTIPAAVVDQCVHPCLFYVNETHISRRGNIFNPTFSDATEFEVPFGLSQNVKTLDYHFKYKRIYWYTANQVYSSGFEPRAAIKSLKLQVGEISGLTVDWQYELLYWTDRVYRLIGVSGLNGEHQSVIYREFTDGEFPTHVAVIGEQGLIFSVWRNSNTGYHVRKTSLITSITETEYTGYNSVVISLVINRRQNKIYIAETSGQIISFDYSGNNKKSMTFDGISGLVITYKGATSQLYVLKSDKKLFMLRDIPEKPQEVLTFNVGSVSTSDLLVIYHNESQIDRTIVTKCPSQICSHLCLYAMPGGHVCTCPIGWQLKTDRVTCEKVNSVAAIVAKEEDKLRMTELYSGDTGEYKRKDIYFSDLVEGVKIDVHDMVATETDLIFIDRTNSWLLKVNMETKKITLLSSRFEYTSGTHLQYDHISNLLYLTCCNNKGVMVANLKGEVKHILETTDYDIIDMVVSSQHAFFVTLEKKSTNYQCSLYKLDGTKVKTYSAGPNMISHIAYDYTKTRIFWHDSHTKTITYYIHSTNVKNVYVNNIHRLNMMAVQGDKLLWMTDNKYLYMVSLTEANPSSSQSLIMVYDAPVEIPVSINAPLTASSHPCFVNNGNCSHLCLRTNNKAYKCDCPEDMKIDATNIKQCAFITTTQTAHACEHQASKELKCEDGHYLHITHAMYGRLRADICINTPSRNCVAASSLTVVRSKCQHKQTCTVTATNTWFGDPCVNVVKYLEVRYQCIRNKAQATICPSPCLYYSQETKIIRVSLNKTGIGLNGDAHLVFDLGKQIKSFDVHYNKELLFWSDSNKIYRSKVTGENVEILNDNGIVNPNGIAVDYVNDVIYWTDRTLDTVSVMSINGSESLILHSNTDKVKSPTSIVMDIGYDGGLLFWINDKTPTPSIGSSKLSGTNLKSYKISSLSSPQDLHVDVVGKNLYWISIKGVEQMSYTGGNKKTFTAASGLSIENSFTILGTQGLFYRTLQKAVSVQRFKPSTVNENNIPISGMTADAKIKAVVTPPSLTSSCTNKNCINGLCLNGGVCTCKRGYKLVDKQCSPSNPTHEFLLLKNGRFHHQKLYANGLEDTMILISDFVGKNFNPVSFDVDWKQSYLYWYDQTLHSIMQMSLGDKDIKVVVKIPSYIFTVSNIRYEHLQDVIYWIEDGGVYKCSARNGSMLVAVYDKGLLPRSHLQLASREGFIFFVETNSSSKLTTIHHGTFSQYVEKILYRAYMPIDMLTVDQFGSRLYWISAHELKSCNFDGSNVITIISQTTYVPKTKLFVESGDLLDDVFGLQVDEINVFWFASNKNSYYKADKLTASPFSVVYGIDVSGNETGILQLEMKKQEVIDKKILLHNYTYSYSTADSLCSTSSTCGYGTAPVDPPNCPLGYISKQMSEEVCGTCDEAVGISFVCQCNDWMTCNHRWSSSVTCPYQSPYLRMKARKCLKTIKSGFCPPYECQPNEATDNKCLSDDDCAETSNKCCLTYCGRRCLKKSAANTSPCEVNNDGCSHVCVTTEYNHAVCQCPYNMEINEDATTCKYTAGYCSGNPCFGSTCVDRIDSFECICNGFLYGDHCEHGFCISSPCQNGATCEEYYGGYTCTCVAGYNGDNCEKIDHCYENECEGNSTCIAGTNPYSCKCDAFHSGTYCENLSYCAILPCLNGGSCTDTATGYQCQCERDYVGTTCADLHPCFKLPCLNGGKCAFKGESYQCLCEGYYAGDNCDIFYGDNIASTTLKETSGKQVTAQTFKETMALVYTEYCATNDCTTGAVFPSRTRRATEKLEFKPRHIIVVVGYPKVVGQGEVQILYSVLMPVDEAKQAGLINVEDVVKGMESSSSIIENKLGANVVETSKYVQPEAAKTDDGNQIVLIGAAAGGGVVVLIVLIITIGCCVVKRKGNRNKDIHIMMTNPLGGTSVYHGKLHNSARPSIDSRYTQSTEFGFPSTTRSTIGAAPPPPDYPRGAHADGGVLYEGIDDYNAKHNEVFYLESEELKTNVNNKVAENPYTGLGQNTEKKYDSNYMGLKFPDQNETYVTPNAQQRDENYRLSEKFLAAEREKSFSSSGNYTADDYAMYDDSYDGKDDYLPLQNS